MFGSLNTSKFARIRSFSDADIYFRNTPAIRGWSKTDGVPLRSDRKDWKDKSIRRLNDGSYALRLYYTDVVIYRPDGRIEVDVSYNSNSTNEFAGALTPYDLSFSSIFNKPVVRVDGGFYLASKPMTFIKNPETRDWVLKDPDRYAVTKQALNRKRAKAVREMLRPLMEFAKVMRGMGPLEESAVVGVPSVNIRSLDVSEEDITNPDNFMMFLRPYYMVAWLNGVRKARLQGNTEWSITEEAYRRFGAHDRIPLPQGVIHKTMQYAN